MADKQTLSVYAEKARDYAERFASGGPGQHLKAFVDTMPEAACILDLGCGPGNAAAIMIAAGHHVDAWDASPDMAAMAKELFGIDVKVATFESLDATDHYDGIYANFSLLHSPKQEMSDHLARIARALKSDGILHLGLKTGTGEHRDRLGRFYAYYSEPELTDLLATVHLKIKSAVTGEEAGLDGTVSPWIILQAHK